MQLTSTLSIRSYRIAISSVFFLSGLTFSSWASRIPDIKSTLHLSDAGLGMVLFALPVGQIISLPVTAWLLSRKGSKGVLIIAALLYSVSLILLSLVSTSAMLAAVLLMFGFFANLLNIAMNTQAVDLESIYGRSIMASFHGLWSLGCFSGAIIGGLFVSQQLPPLPHFTLVFTLASAILLFAHRFLLDHDDKKNKTTGFSFNPGRQILILGLIAFFCMVCEGAMADWSGVYFQKILKASEAFLTAGYIAFTAMMATGRFLADGLVEKYGVKNILRISGVLIATGLAIAIAFPATVTATFGFLLVGLGTSSVVPIAFGLAGKTNTMTASTALATVSSISFLGFLIGPPMIGFIAEGFSLQGSFAVVALLGLGTAFFSGKIKLSND